MEELRVEVQEDHLQSLTSASPIKAIEELIYNALDADATFIDILFERNDMGGVSSIHINDNGLGIHKSNIKYFRGLGGSWKKRQEGLLQKVELSMGSLEKEDLRLLLLAN